MEPGSEAPGALRVVVYTKPGCGLCEPLMRTVEKVRDDLDFSLEEVDIARDTALLAQYGHEVPVVLINGRKAFKGRLTEQAFRNRLKKAKDERRAKDDVRSLDALEELEPEPFIPPRPVATFLLIATLAVFGCFVALGVVEAWQGKGHLAGRLLKIQPRRESPVHFTLESMSGGKIALDDFRDKIVFLNFWATWCPPCIEEMPSMMRLHGRLKSHPEFVMLAVSADEGWEPVRMLFAGKPQEDLRVLLDQSGKIARDYGTTMFPETYIIDHGKVVAFIEGPRDWDQWFAEEYLRSLL